MKRVLLVLLSLLSLTTVSSTSQAADLRHTLGGSSLNSFFTDDRGGSVNNGGSNLSYYFNLNDVDQSAFGTLFLYHPDGGGSAGLGFLLLPFALGILSLRRVRKI